MILRKLNLAPRSALSFGFFCLMTIWLGLFSAQPSLKFERTSEVCREQRVPSILLFVKMDREFLSIKNNMRDFVTPLSLPNAELKRGWRFKNRERIFRTSFRGSSP